MLNHRLTATVAAPIVLAAGLLTACGSSGGGNDRGASTSGTTPGGASSSAAQNPPAASGGSVSAPCDVTDPATVTAVFGGTSAPEKAGTGRNCQYTLTGAKAPVVDVYYFGDDSDWAAQRTQANKMTGPITDVKVGDDAYTLPGGLNTLVVKADGFIFGVQVIDLSPKNKGRYLPQLTTLANKIIAQHA